MCVFNSHIGQYDGKSKPLPEYHVKISGFDEKVSYLSLPPFYRQTCLRRDRDKTR